MGPFESRRGARGVGHLFSGRFGELVIGSTFDHDHLIPWGSHPRCDRLLASSEIDVVHDGAACNRVEKTRTIAIREELLRKLRVCFSSKGSHNCSSCGKCLRTMVTLDLYGAREAAVSFDWSGYSLDRVAEVYLENDSGETFFQEIRRAAIEEGRNDIVEAIDQSLRTSKRLLRIREPIRGKLKEIVAHRYMRPIYNRISGGARAYR